MSASNNPQPSRSSSNLTGQLTAIIILICVVIGLVLAVVLEPEFGGTDQVTQIATTVTPFLLGTPSQTEVGAVTPPSVNIDKVIIVGGVLVLIVLLAIWREILWSKQHS